MIWFCKSLLSQIQWIIYSLCTGPSCSWWVPQNSTRIEDRSLLLLQRAKHSFIKIYYKVLQAYTMKLKAFISGVDSLYKLQEGTLPSWLGKSIVSWDDVKISQMVSQMRRSHKGFLKMMKKTSTTSVVGSSVLLGKTNIFDWQRKDLCSTPNFVVLTSCKLKLLDLNHKHRVWAPTYLSTIPFSISYQLQYTYPLMPSFRWELRMEQASCSRLSWSMEHWSRFLLLAN